MQEPDIATDLRIEKVQWKQEASLEQLSLVGTAKPLPIEQAQADIRLNASGFKYQDQTVDSANVTLSGTQAAHTLTLDVVSKLASIKLAVSGALTEKPSLTWTGELADVHIETEQGPLDLTEPVAIKVDIDKQVANVAAHCWHKLTLDCV